MVDGYEREKASRALIGMKAINAATADKKLYEVMQREFLKVING